jgi:endoglucanase
LKEEDIPQFFWCLNPDSGDTGGLLEDDWKTPVAIKLNLLQTLVPHPTSFSLKDGMISINNHSDHI